jgi:hypothetical protein
MSCNHWVLKGQGLSSAASKGLSVHKPDGIVSVLTGR